MSKKKPHPHASMPSPTQPVAPPDMPTTEQTLGLWTEALQRGLLHSADRPEAEERLLRFLAHARDPTAAGLGLLMGSSAEESAALLAELAGAGLAWQDPAAAPPGWHLSTEGHRYLSDRQILPPTPPQP